jgi:hypothetical protein
LLSRARSSSGRTPSCLQGILFQLFFIYFFIFFLNSALLSRARSSSDRTPSCLKGIYSAFVKKNYFFFLQKKKRVALSLQLWQDALVAIGR